MRFFRSRARPAGSPDAVPSPTEPSEQRSEPQVASSAADRSAEPSATVGEHREPEPTPRLQPDVTSDPAPEPERGPQGETPAGEPRVGAFTSRSLGVPQQWNLWELERVAREQSGADAARDEERSFLLIYLREFADANGVLPTSFDGVVRESFGDVLDAVGA